MDIKAQKQNTANRKPFKPVLSRWLGNIVRREVLQLETTNATWKKYISNAYNLVFVKHWRLSLNCLLILAVVAPIGWQVGSHFKLEQRYELSAATRQLVGPADSPLATQLKYDAKTQTYVFNPTAFTSAGSSSDSVQLGSSVKDPLYGAKLAATSGSLSVADKTTGLSFGITPLFGTHSAKAVGNDGQPQGASAAADHIVYPSDVAAATTVYTVKNNGVKEDVVLTKGPSSGTINLNYKLDLPSTLTARLDAHGNLDIYSADPSLFGNITYGDSTSQQEVMKARQNSAKDNLVFVLPVPTIYESGSQASDPSGSQARFNLKGNILTVTATGLSDLHYPATIDPSVVVTAASDFQLGGNDESNISYASNEISTAGLTGGSTGTWQTNTNTMSDQEAFTQSVAYNGYIYVIGGGKGGGSPTDYVQYALINSNGSVGTFATTTPLAVSVAEHSAVAYNGYLYVLGGCSASSGGLVECDTDQNAVQYAPLNANGTVGTWQTTVPFSGQRVRLEAVAYNGYMYVMGGYNDSDATDYNDVQYAPINADGSIGEWQETTAFATARDAFGAAAYNGYLYVLGGQPASDGSDYNTVQYAPLNANGTVGMWQTTSSFTTARDELGAVAYDGYLYIYGGYSNSNGAAHGDSQYASINANGSIGPWQPAAGTMPSADYGFGFAAYNGYVYTLGGEDALSTVQYAPINPAGVTSSWSTSSSILTVTKGGSVVAYNGYIYKLGGNNASGYYCDVEFAPISSNGTIGTWLYTYSSTTSTTYHCGFTTGRYWGEAVAYSGYLYIMGGCSAGSCSTALNDVQYAPINSNGTIGTWKYTYNNTSGSTQGGGFYTARYGEAAAEYNGYLYIMGGATAGEVMQSDVQYAPINSNGTVGTWQYTYNSTSGSSQTGGFSPARYGLAAVAYGGYLYIMGGCNNTSWYNDVQYAPINSNGTIGTWRSAGTFTNARYGLTADAANGYIYIMGGVSSGFSTAYNDVQYASIQANGSLNSFQTSVTFTSTRFDLMSTMYNGYLYIVGGVSTGGTYYAPVQYASINNGGPGTTTAWGAATSLGTAQDTFASVAYNNYLYVLGGSTNGGATGVQNEVQYAPISSGGTIGSWASTLTFSTARYGLAAVAYNGYMYILGGTNSSGTTLQDVQYAPINSNGTIGTWAPTQSLGAGYFDPDAVVYNGYLYVLGGSLSNNVQYAPINSNGTIGTWTTTSSFTTGREYAAAVAYNGYMYIMGGGSSSATLNDVQYAPINSNGSLGSWSYTTNLGPNRKEFSAVAFNGYLYVIDGWNDSGDLDTYEYAPINGTGTLGNWMMVTPSGTSLSYGGIDAAYNGYLYIMGGNGGGDSTTVDYAGLNSIPRIGQYSKLIDLTGAGTNGSPSSLGTVGPTSTSGSTDVGNCNYMNMTEVNAGSLTGNVNSISVNVGFISSNNHMQVAIYSNVSGSPDLPGSLLATSSSQLLTINAWNTFTVSGVSVTAGANYWIGFNVDNCNTNYGWAGTTGSGSGKAENITWESGVTYGTWPSTWTYGIGSGGYTSGNGYAVYASISTLATGTAANDPLPASYIMSGTNTGSPGYGQPGWPSGIGLSYALASSNCTTFGSLGSLDSGTASPLGTAWPFGTLTPGGGCAISGNGHYVWVHFTLNDTQTSTFPDSLGNHSSVSDFTLNYHPGSGSRLRGGASFGNGSLQSLDAHP